MEEDEDGNTVHKTIIVEPARWTFSTLNCALQVLADDPSAKRSLTMDPEWLELRDTILKVLDAYPEAKEALLYALSEES